MKKRSTLTLLTVLLLILVPINIGEVKATTDNSGPGGLLHIKFSSNEKAYIKNAYEIDELFYVEYRGFSTMHMKIGVKASITTTTADTQYSFFSIENRENGQIFLELSFYYTGSETQIRLLYVNKSYELEYITAPFTANNTWVYYKVDWTEDYIALYQNQDLIVKKTDAADEAFAYVNIIIGQHTPQTLNADVYYDIFWLTKIKDGKESIRLWLDQSWKLENYNVTKSSGATVERIDKGKPLFGQEPTYKYFFVHDPNLDIEAKAKYGLPSFSVDRPPGQWYPGLAMDPDPTDYVRIKNGRARLKVESHAIDGSTWSSAHFGQGIPPYSPFLDGSLLGSNTNETVAVDTLRIVYPMNQTLNEGELFLFIKAKIIEQYEIGGINPSWGLGIFFGFQYELKNKNTGKYFLSDYSFRVKSAPAQVLHFDVWLERYAKYSLKLTGAGTKYHGDIWVQYVAGDMKPGIWYAFKLDVHFLIEEAKKMVKDVWQAVIEEGSYWHSEHEVTALILRYVHVMAEATGAYLEAVVDYVLLSTDQYALQRIDLRSYDWSDYDGVSGSPAPAVWEIDYEFWGVSKGDKGPTIYLPKNSYHRVEVEDPLWQWNSSSQTWIVWHFFQYWNDEVAPLLSSENPLEIYTGIYDGYMHALFYKEEIEPVYDGGGSLFELVGPGDASGFMMTESPPVEAEYGQIKRVNQSGWIDKVTFVRIRQTLGNQHGDLVVSVFLKEKYKTIVIKLNNIEKIIIDLGRIMEVYGYNQNFWSYQVDDFTMTIETQNVTYTDFILLNVPPLLTLKKNGIAMPKGSFWNYTNGHLHFRLYSGDPEIYVDFETAFSLTYNVLIQSSTVLIAMLTVALLYKKLRSLKL